MTIEEAIVTQELYVRKFTELRDWLSYCPKKFQRESKKISKELLRSLHAKFLDEQVRILEALKWYKNEKFSDKTIVVDGKRPDEAEND